MVWSGAIARAKLLIPCFAAPYKGVRILDFCAPVLDIKMMFPG
jgi:hypothetical protein